MRKSLFALIALAAPALACTSGGASAQGVYVGVGPVGVGVGVGSDWYGYGPYDAYAYDDPGYYYSYGYSAAPYYGYAPRRTVYGYRGGYVAPRVYGYAAPAAPAPRTEVQIPVREPGNCGTYFYWKDGRCVDARMK
jgi:hypothetical protein